MYYTNHRNEPNTMNNDQENTARKLIASAFDTSNISKVSGPRDLAKMLAKNLRDDPDLFPGLLNSPEAVLLTVKMNELTDSTENSPALGALEVELVARIKHQESPLLDILTNPEQQNYAYAIALAAEDEEKQSGLMLIFCTRTGNNYLALALNDNDKTIETWQADHHEPMPNDLARTVEKLSKAITA